MTGKPSPQPQPQSIPHASQPIDLRSGGLALLTSALWGGTPVAISYSVDQLPPQAVAAIRFGLAAIFMLIWCRWEGTALTLAPRQLRTVLIAGTMLFAQIGLFNEGIARSNSSHASILINTFVFWVPAIEFIFVRHNRLSPAQLAGLLLAGSGGLIVVSTSNSTSSTAGLDQPSLIGDAFLLLSGFLLAIKIVYTQHALKSMEPGKFIFWHDVIGVAFFALWSGCFETFPVGLSALSLATWLGLLYQGLLVAGFCFAVQAWMLKRHPASQISVFSCSTPLFGVALGVLFRDDGLSEWLLLAAACVAIGILIVTYPAKRE